ncbi:MAG TPA: sugar ABC transporter permease [Candidatus Binatia bacterium]|jgi:multiple sugar transport system permease protein
MKARDARSTAGLLLAGPALALIVVFFFLPVAASLLLSVTDFDVYALANPHDLRFVALDNYRALLADPQFWTALRNTFYFVLVGGPLSIGVSLAAALLVDSRVARMKGLMRTVFFLPVTTTIVAVAVVWRYLYHPRFGLIDQALGAFGVRPVDWLGDPVWSMPAIILMAVWKNFGFNMIILLAGLQGIPERLYEAASLDGAGAWRRLRSITLPLLAPTLGFVSLLTAIGYFQLFAEPYVMTQGGPAGSTRSIVLLMYEEGFRWWNLGRAAAVAFLLFVVLLAATAIPVALRRLRRPALFATGEGVHR